MADKKIYPNPPPVGNRRYAPKQSRLYRIWLTQQRRKERLANIFSPLSLFEPGDKGFLYETSKIANLGTGSGPVTADADPIGIVSDSTSGGNDATQSTSGDKPAYYSPRWMDFDGSTDHLLVVDNASSSDFHDFNQAISGAFRVQVPDNYAADVPPLVNVPAAVILALNEDDSAFDNRRWVCNFGFRDGKLRIGSAVDPVVVDNTGTFGESSGVTFTPGEERTVGFTIDGDDWAIYVDGELNNSGTFTAYTGSGDRSLGANNGTLSLGANMSSGGGVSSANAYNGRFGDSIFINKVLTAEDFTNLHNIWSAS